MPQVKDWTSKRLWRVRVVGFLLALLVLVAGAIAWVLTNLTSLPALLTTIFGALAVIIAFIQLVPIIFPPKPSGDPSPELPTTMSASQSTNIYNILPLPQPALTTTSPNSSITPSTGLPPQANVITLRDQPPPTDPHSIQQRAQVVHEIYAKLVDPNTAAVVLTGIGGIGKSTLASLIFNYAERERHVGRGPFLSETIFLRINKYTTFIELVTNLFTAVRKQIADLPGTSAQNQAYAVFSALISDEAAQMPRLIIIDQFDSLLDPQSGHALATHTGVEEFIDALNSQPSNCRLLLTSRVQPHGIRSDVPASLQVYEVSGLSEAEGLALLSSQGVTGSKAEMQKAVRYCGGHALALTLLSTLLKTYKENLATILEHPSYNELWSGAIAEKLLDHIFQSLPEPLRQLLCACSVYRETVPLAALQAIVPNTATQVLTMLGSLLEQHLVQAQATGYQLHPIVATYAEQHFVIGSIAANRQVKRPAHVLAANYYQQLAILQCPPIDKRRQITDLHPLVESVWHLCKAESFQEAYLLMVREDIFRALRITGGNVKLIELCQQLLEKTWQCTQHQRAFIYTEMATGHYMLGQTQDALQYYEQGRRIYREVGDRRGEGATLNKLGLMYNALEQYQEASQYYEQTLHISREIGEHAGEGATLNNLGSVYHAMGQSEEALQCYEQALHFFRENGNRADEGTALNNLGEVYFTLAQHREALQFYEHALGIKKELGDKRGEGVVFNNLGRLYNILGMQQKSLQSYKEALRLHKEVENPYLEGIALHNLGIIYADKRQHQLSLAFILQAQEHFRSVKSSRSSKYIDIESKWLQDLREQLGEELFATLFTKAELRAKKIVSEALKA